MLSNQMIKVEREKKEIIPGHLENNIDMVGVTVEEGRVDKNTDYILVTNQTKEPVRIMPGVPIGRINKKAEFKEFKEEIGEKVEIAKKETTEFTTKAKEAMKNGLNQNQKDKLYQVLKRFNNTFKQKISIDEVSEHLPKHKIKLVDRAKAVVTAMQRQGQRKDNRRSDGRSRKKEANRRRKWRMEKQSGISKEAGWYLENNN